MLRKLALSVVAAVAETHLRKVVGTEAEEFGFLGQLGGGKSGPGDFNHGAVFDIDPGASVPFDLIFDPINEGAKVDEFVDVGSEGNHDFGMDGDAL